GDGAVVLLDGHEGDRVQGVAAGACELHKYLNGRRGGDAHSLGEKAGGGAPPGAAQPGGHSGRAGTASGGPGGRASGEAGKARAIPNVSSITGGGGLTMPPLLP